jgi:DNA-binding YbaB/EbfC family protein
MFKGLGNLADIAGLFKQAQEMGGKMGQLGEELKAKRVVGKAGAGLVEVLANGVGEVLAVRIEPSLIEKQDRELLEDLLPAAFNDARQKAQQLHAEQLQQLTGGLNIPGLGEALGQMGTDTTRE